MSALQKVTYNLSNADHFRIVVSKFGGEYIICRKYLELFKILMYSRDMEARETCKQQIVRSDSGGDPGFVEVISMESNNTY